VSRLTASASEVMNRSGMCRLGRGAGVLK